MKYIWSNGDAGESLTHAELPNLELCCYFNKPIQCGLNFLFG